MQTTLSTTEAPRARMEFEVKQVNGIKRTLRQFRKNDNLYELSDELEEYRGFVVSDINALENTVRHQRRCVAGQEATGDVNETALRRIQIREWGTGETQPGDTLANVRQSDRITMDPEIMGGKPCIRLIRVTVGMIAGAAAAGRTIAELLVDFPYLDEPDIHEALAFAAAR